MAGEDSTTVSFGMMIDNNIVCLWRMGNFVQNICACIL